MRARGSQNLDDIRRSLRLGMGPCQGGFCIPRATGILHALDRLSADEANRACARSSRSAGRACTRSSTATSCARHASTTGSSRACSTSSTCLPRPRGTSRRRPSERVMRCDVIVAGAGTAGLTAAVRAAQAGKKVLVLAKGAGATHLAPLTIDVLGYAPDRVDSPAASLGGFLADNPDHPYARTGEAAIGEALAWFSERMAEAYPYTGGLERNLLLPSAVGAWRPSALVPVTMAEGDLRREDPMVIVGLRPLKDFYAALVADNLQRAGMSARAVELDIEVDRGRRQRAGPRPRAGPARGPLHGRRPARGPPEGRRAGGVPGGARPAPRAHGLERAAGAARASGLRDPDGAAVRPRAARRPDPHRGAARGRRSRDPRVARSSARCRTPTA